VEAENLPADCKQALGDIERVINASGKLTVIVSISPDLVAPRPRGITSVMSLLWNLGKGEFDYARRRAKVKALLDSTTRNRIKTIIELQIVKHELDNNRELVDHWKRILDSYGDE
jgi:hypothetical protein